MTDAKIIHPAQTYAIPELLSQLSERDRDELFELAGNTAAVSELLIGMILSSVWSFMAIEESGVVICMGGVTGGKGAVTGGGQAWMIASEAGLERHRKQFLRVSRNEIEALLTRWPRLRAFVDERWTKSLRWLSWLGFTDKGGGEYCGRRFRVMEIGA